MGNGFIDRVDGVAMAHGGERGVGRARGASQNRGLAVVQPRKPARAGDQERRASGGADWLATRAVLSSLPAVTIRFCPLQYCPL
jgi:hypothetical protein